MTERVTMQGEGQNMIYTATDKTIYTAQDLAEALNAAQREAQRVELDKHSVDLVLAWLARRWGLTGIDPTV